MSNNVILSRRLDRVGLLESLRKDLRQGPVEPQENVQRRQDGRHARRGQDVQGDPERNEVVLDGQVQQLRIHKTRGEETRDSL